MSKVQQVCSKIHLFFYMEICILKDMKVYSVNWPDLFEVVLLCTLWTFHLGERTCEVHYDLLGTPLGIQCRPVQLDLLRSLCSHFLHLHFFLILNPKLGMDPKRRKKKLK